MAKFTFGDVRFLAHTYECLLPLEVHELLTELLDKKGEAVLWEEDAETHEGPEPSPYLQTAPQRARRKRRRLEREKAASKRSPSQA